MQKFRPDLQYRAIQGPLLTRELVLAFDKNQQHQRAMKLLCEIAARAG